MSLKLLKIKLYRNRRILIFPTIITLFLVLFIYKNSRELSNISDVFNEKVQIKLRNPRDLNSKSSSEVTYDASDQLTRKLPVSHVFIVSAYYYPQSKSLGSNAVALNMIVDSKNFDVENASFSIVGTNGTHEKQSTATSQTENVEKCRYSPVVAVTNTVEKMSMLEIESDGIKLEIPFKLARSTAPKPIIICISPQFVAEQWQIFMLNVHTANRFGAHLHIYIISMIDSLFGLMKEYEKQGYVSIDFWLRMKFSESSTPYIEPNSNTELSNQAGANTDCLLQYKEAAKYIAFFDMDDILFPFPIHPTYLKEFNAEFSFREKITSIEYIRKEYEFVKATEMTRFSFYDVLGSLRWSKKFGRGAIVLKPSHYNITGIRGNQHELSISSRTIDHTPIIHIKWPLQRNHVDSVTKILKSDFDRIKEKIRPKDIMEIEKDIWRMRELPEVADVAQNLPKSDFYFPIVSKCYQDILSSESGEPIHDSKKCANLESCALPQNEEYKCVHSDADYFSGYHMKPFTFHFANNSFWSYDIGCFQ